MMKKIGLGLVIGALLLAIAPSVYADGSITITGTALGVTNTSFPFPAASLHGSDQTKEFTDFSTGTGGPGVWTAVDPTGTGLGWHLQIQATDFACYDDGTHDYPCWGSGAGGTGDHPLPLLYTDKHLNNPTFFMHITVPDIYWVDGSYGTCNGATGTAACVATKGGTQGSGDNIDGSLMPVPANGFDTNPVGGFYQKALTNTAQTFMTASTSEGMGSYEFDPDFQIFIPAETYAGKYRSTLTVTIVSAP
jgi:hypothetical protein